MIQNVFKKKSMILLTMASVLTFGSFALMGDSIAMAASPPPQTSAGVGIIEVNLGDSMKEVMVEIDKETSELSEKEKQEAVEESNERAVEEKPAPQFIKELEPNHELPLGGFNWNVINPQDGFIIMLDSVEDLKLDFEYKGGEYNEILEYLDNKFMATLTDVEKALLVEDQFGLTFFNDKLYVTANLNPDAKLSELEVNAGVEEKEVDKVEQEEKEGSMAWLYVLIALILMVVVGLFVKYLKDKNTEKEKQEKDKK